MKEEITYSIIVLTWNGLNDTKEFYESVMNTVSESFELIIIDNGSTDGTIEWVQSLKIKHNLKKINLKLVEHTGFSEAVNIGINEASTQYPIVCNNDIIVTPGWIENTVDCLIEYSEFAVVVPTTNMCGQRLQYCPNNDCCKPALIPSDDVNFVCFAINKSFWTEHHLDEHYISGVEDIDYCKIVWLNNKRVGVNLGSWVFHKGEQTNKREYASKQEDNLRNGWMIFAKRWKNYKGLERANEYFNYNDINKLKEEIKYIKVEVIK